jgi:hypothetical protein
MMMMIMIHFLRRDFRAHAFTSMSAKIFFLFVTTSLLSVACSPDAGIAKLPDSGTGDDAPPGTCTTNAECGPGYVCDHPTTKCGSAQSKCVPAANTCTTSADCASGLLCAFAISDACGAQGTCLPQSQGCFCAAEECACDGTTVEVGCAAQLPSGYAPKPIAHDGACATDGGTCPGTTPTNGSPCTTLGEICSYQPNTTCQCALDDGGKDPVWACAF